MFILKGLCRIFASGVMGGILSALTLLISAMAGLYYSKLTSTQSSGVIGNLSTVFSEMSVWEVQLLSITLILAIVRSVAVIADNYIKKIELSRRQEFEKTVPDAKWFAGNYYSRVKDIIRYQSMIGDMKKDEILDVIKASLGAIRDLAYQYDYEPKDTITVNLMTLIPVEDLDFLLEKDWKRLNIFFDGANVQSAIKQVDGVLAPFAVAHSGLKPSIYIDENESEEPLLLPVVDEQHRENRTLQRFIGAPAAIENGKAQYYPRFLISVDEWLNKEQKRIIPQLRATKILRHYINDTSIRSLYSVPLKSPYEVYKENGDDSNQDGALLVLNIYAQHDRVLRGNPEVFDCMVRPIMDTLAMAFDCLLEETDNQSVEEQNLLEEQHGTEKTNH